MLRTLASLSLLALVLTPPPVHALIGEVPTIRRVALCPSDPAQPRNRRIAMLGQEADGSFVLMVRTFDHETGGQRGTTLSVPIPRGTVPVDLVVSTAFAPGQVLVLDTDLRVHGFLVVFDGDGTPRLVGETPTHGPFGDPMVVGAGTALAEAPAIDGEAPSLGIGTTRGRLILAQRGSAAAGVLPIAAAPIEDVAAVPQVGYFAFVAVASGRLFGVDPDADGGTPGPQPALRFTCIPPLGWPLGDVAAPPLEPGDLLREPAPVALAAANGSPASVVLEIPANPAFGSRLRARYVEQDNVRISRVAVGLMQEEGLVLLSAAGTGVTFDPGFTLEGGFTSVDLTITGASATCQNNLASPLVRVVIEVENGFTTKIDWATLALTAGASSILPLSEPAPHLGDDDGDGNEDLTVWFDREAVLRMLIRERTLDLLATWKFIDTSRGRASARFRLVIN